MVRETRGSDVVSIQVWVRAGSRFETAANNGVARVIEAAALRASDNYPRSATGGAGGGPAEAIQSLGGAVGSQTSRDATFYSATVAAAWLPAAMRAISDAVLRPNLGDNEIEAAKSDVETDLQRRSADPVATVSDLLYQTAFTKHPYRRPAAGSVDSIEALVGKDVRAFHRLHYVGPNISVIIVGDVRRSVAHALVAQYFESAPGTHAPALTIPVETAPTAYKTVSRRALARATTLGVAFRAPGISKPDDVVAMDVLLAYWREGQAAALRDVLLGKGTPQDDDHSPLEGDDAPKADQAMAIAFDVDFLTQRDPSLFVVSLVVDPTRRSDAVGALLDAVGQVQSKPVDAHALDIAKLALARQYVEQDETVSGQAGALGFYEMIATYEFAATYLQRVARVTPADVKRVANTYLSKTVYVQASIDPAPRPRPPTRPPRDNTGTITAVLPVAAQRRPQ